MKTAQFPSLQHPSSPLYLAVFFGFVYNERIMFFTHERGV